MQKGWNTTLYASHSQIFHSWLMALDLFFSLWLIVSLGSSFTCSYNIRHYTHSNRMSLIGSPSSQNRNNTTKQNTNQQTLKATPNAIVKKWNTKWYRRSSDCSISIKTIFLQQQGLLENDTQSSYPPVCHLMQLVQITSATLLYKLCGCGKVIYRCRTAVVPTLQVS